MKKAILLMAMAALGLSGSAATTHTLRGEVFDVDTLKHYKNGPGMTFTALRYQSQTRVAKHFNSFVITADLKNNDNLDFRMHLGCDSVHTSERMTTVAQRHTDENNQYIAAMNGDFFITWSSTPGMLGYPNMTACSAGQMALSDNVDHDNHIDAWIMDWKKGMWCDQTVLDNKVTLPDGSQVGLYGVNFARRDDARRNAESDQNDVVFYNEHRGYYTGSAAGWKEVTVALAEGEQWRINSPVKLVVTSDMHTTGHMAIPRNGGVLAAGPATTGVVETLKVGDVVTLNIGLSLPNFDNLKPDVKEVVGGDVTLLRNGEAVTVANRFINPCESENPRTMVGYDAERTKMVWCVVDGRSTTNTGCTYPQGAEMMRYYGCVDAVNFDGGGSTMMWTQQTGIVNDPSDGKERAVGNGIFAVLKAPVDNTIAEIRFLDWRKNLPQYGQYTPVIYGYNQYGQLISTNVEGFTLEAPAELGTVTGTTLLADGSGSHALKAHYNGLEAVIPVTVAAGGDIQFAQDAMLIDNIRSWQIKAVANVDGSQLPLAPQALTWASENSSIVEVDDLGNIKGYADGVVKVNGAVGDFNGAVEVTVECPRARIMDVQAPIQLDSWTIKGSNTTVSPSVLNENGIAIDYNVTSARNPSITLTPTGGMRLWSIPDAVQLEVKGSGTITKAVVNIKPNGGRNNAITISDLKIGENNTLIFPIAEVVDVNDPAVYPLTMASFSFTLSGTGENRVEVSRIATVYEGFAGIEDVMADGVDGFDPTAPVEYYNLQGIRIINPSSGQLLIRRQGIRASKVIFK